MTDLIREIINEAIAKLPPVVEEAILEPVVVGDLGGHKTGPHTECPVCAAAFCCQECDGKGWIIPRWYVWEPRRKRCPKCKGTGQDRA